MLTSLSPGPASGARAGTPKTAPGGRRFVGSKNGSGVWQRILSEMPPHRVFIDAFLGTGAITQRKLPAAASIAIDMDPAAPGLTRIELLRDQLCLTGDAVRILSLLSPMVDRTWLVYCDPPYLFSVRSYKGKYYRCEFGMEHEHEQLLTVLQGLKCNVMLSGYDSDLYRRYLIDWRVVVVPTVKRNGERSRECIWMNFPEPFAFHDVRFLGRNFRERERIKRKRSRWKDVIAACHVGFDEYVGARELVMVDDRYGQHMARVLAWNNIPTVYARREDNDELEELEPWRIHKIQKQP
jgi:DNA adenine methylase